MPVAPIAKGIIIAASVVVAAGVAFYENPQVREWVDASRRKLAIALHSLGDEINPTASRSRRNSAPASTNASTNNETAMRKAREEQLRTKRTEMIRKAREEGVAVDLNALADIGEELERLGNASHGIRIAETKQRNKDPSASQGRRGRSFDELVDRDGKLVSSIGASTAIENAGEHLRNRGAGHPHTAESTEIFANPFADDNATQPEPEKSSDSQSLLTASRLSQLDMSFAHHTSTDESRGTQQRPDTPTTGAVAATPTTESAEMVESYHSFAQSQSEDAEVISHIGDETSEDFSDVDSAATPSSWTEVGSVDDGESDGGHVV